MPKRPDQRSRAAEAYRAWYWTTRWRKRAKAHLDAEPLCRMCMATGHVTPATVADHIVEHKGDPDLFWNGALQSLCATHHSSTKAREERRGYAIGSSVDGAPLDPGHPWHSG